ncbi:microtubule-actin cross-linking factor 1, isoforms 6/7-like isoform X1 [Erythrolamprus reginae]|uniref:microtubule-actin cross-linking factor 1, isoforms 6/7-like isoform X1 n=1 Tax=Erythrolamprus reginae TaxID=121349 RepID=UPI00396CF6A0
MGNSVGRPSCLGEKSPRAEDDFPKEPRSAAPKNHPRDEAEVESAGAPEKAALLRHGVMENGWSMALEGATKGSPLPKQSNLDFQLQSQPEGDTWASPESLGPSWGWRLQTAREVKEVTEVTETVVTEIVEVTKHPNGDESREALMARTEAAAPPGGKQGAGLSLEAAGKLGAWIVEVEDLMGHQKPPAGEAKVVEAQLQEQKLLLRLLEERTPHISPLCQPLSAGPASAAEGEEQPKGLDSLQEKWAALVQEAEARHSRLQQIVPAAGLFQESAEAFQDWLSLTEQKLAQLWGGPGSLNALQQIQDLRREVQSKPAQLEDALERGWRLSQMVPGEEGQLVRGQMDSLRLRLLLVDQRSSDTLQRMEQTLGASSCLDPAQDHLQPPEEEQLLPGSQATDRPCPRAPAGEEKVRGSWQLLLKWMERAGAACPTPTGGPPAKQEDLEALLGQHEEFQRRLWAKHPIFGATLQQGGLLCGKALLPADGQELDAMQRELKEHWGPLWSWAAERQQKVEEQLLFSSRLGDALQGLLDWLCRAESQLAEATPVPGDRDLVGTLMEQHKAFQTELGRRAVAVRTLRCSAHVLAPGRSSVDARWLQIQMEELGDPWDLIGRLSICQQDRLEVALRQA